jgi:hypothetical protein
MQNRVILSESLLKINQDDQTKHLNYLARCPLEVRLALFEKKRDIFHQLFQKYKGQIVASDLSYVSLILAIGATRSMERNLTKKSFGDLTLDEIRDLSSMRAVTFKHKTTRVTQKHEKLLGYWAIIRTLRLDHGYSYERVSQYLNKKHRFSIAPSTIMKKWHLFENNKMEDKNV